MIIYIMLAILLLAELHYAFKSGRARGFQHARRDYPDIDRARLTIPINHYLGKSAGYLQDNGEPFNQSYWWLADHPHRMMHFQVLNLLGALSMAMIIAVLTYKVIAWGMLVTIPIHVWACWWIEGRGFTLYYHVLLPIIPRDCDYDWKTWWKGWVSL